MPGAWQVANLYSLLGDQTLRIAGETSDKEISG